MPDLEIARDAKRASQAVSDAGQSVLTGVDQVYIAAQGVEWSGVWVVLTCLLVGVTRFGIFSTQAIAADSTSSNLPPGFVLDPPQALGTGYGRAYFCTAEAAGGLRYNKSINKWQGTSFRAESRFVLRLTFVRTYERKKVKSFEDDETFNAYSVTITRGGTNDEEKCEAGNDAEVWVGKHHTVFCNASLTDYKINLATNRYLATYAVGYFAIGQTDENSDTPTITGGTCTKIE